MNADPLTEIAIVSVLAVLVEMLIEYFVKPLIPQPVPEAEDDSTRRRYWQSFPYARFCAAAVAVALCILYRVDVLAMLLPSVDVSYAGMVLTGLLISRGSNYVHDWLANPTGSPA